MSFNALQSVSTEWLTINVFTGGVNLVTSRPGHNDAGAPGKRRPRRIFFPVAGDIVVKDHAGNSDTIKVTAGLQLDFAPESITEAGTTITSCSVFW